MTRLRSLPIVALALCLLPGAQPSAQQTARLAGRVITIDVASQPVRNTTVTVSAPELPQPKSTVSDDEGRFEFGSLPAGRFTITAAKTAYITTAYGARRPGRPGTPVLLAAGQEIEDLTVRLARGAVISGRVTDRAGQPVSSAQVMAIRAELAAGAWGQARATDTFVTDDRGVYRIYGLEPGTYVVAVVPRATGGRDVEVMSSAAIDAVLARLRARAPAATVVPPRATVVAAPVAGYVFSPIYFPATPAVSDAQRLSLSAGDEWIGADIVFEPLEASTVEGVVRTMDGSSPANVSLSLTADGPALPGAAVRPQPAVRPGADGRFRYTGVAPGAYVLTAQTSTSASASVPLFAAETIAVVGNVTGVTLTLAPMPSLKGRITFDGTLPVRPADVTGVRLQLTAPGTTPIVATAPVGGRGASSPTGGVATGSASRGFVFLRQDGTFEFPRMAPGTYRLTIQVPGATPGHGWWARSAMVGGRDVLDTLISLSPGASAAEAVVTLSDRHTELSGTLQTPAGQPATDGFVIVFPTERSLWTPTTRRLQSTRPGTDGAFSFRDLPAGEYFLAALTDLDQDEWQDPAFLTEAATGAVRAALADGQQNVQSLRIRDQP